MTTVFRLGVTEVRQLLIGALFLAAATAGGAAKAAGNLLVNGSFETGNLDGWTLSPINVGLRVVTSGSGLGYTPQQGIYFLAAGAAFSDSFISQTFADTPGELYTAGGWVAGNGTSPSDFGFYLNGVSKISVSPVPDQPYTFYSFQFMGSGSDTFKAAFRNDKSYDAFDNFSVTPSNREGTVPESSTWAMMLVGFAGLAGIGLSRRKRVALG